MRRIFVSILVSLFAFFVFSAGTVSAKVITNQKGDVTIAKTEVVNDDLFVGAQNFILDGTVNGDVFVGAGNVTINGTVNGNLHVGAGKIILAGPVKGSAYIGGGTVNVSKSLIGGSLLIGSGDVTIDKGSIINGSLLVGGGNVTIDSVVKRSAYIGAGNISLGPDAKIAKDLYYGASQNQQFNMASSATVSGAIYKSEARVNTPGMASAQKQFASAIKVASLFATIASFLGALIVGFLYLKFFSSNFMKAADLACNSFFKSLGVGFLVTFLAVPVLLILLVTGIGAGLSGILFLLLLLGLYLAKIVVGMAIGKWAKDKYWKKMSVFGAFVVGLLVVYILKITPFVGFFAGILVLWTGLGAITLSVFSKDK